jgi:RNA polymerase sigma factor (sigma-70 family)
MENRGFEFLTANLPLVERAVAFACRRYNLGPDDAEEFRAIVNLKLVENDCAVLNAYEARSSFATFISIVVKRMALDYRVHTWGKWHTTAGAKRLGPLAVQLERLLYRDGHSLDDAAAILRQPKESLAALAGQLPERTPRLREVAMGETELPARSAATDERVHAGERRRISERVSAIMSSIISRLPQDEQLILQLRFEGGMAVSQIARALQVDQKTLYRRIERQMRALRKELEAAGVDARDVLDLIGSDESNLAFDLGNANWRPSIGADETRPEHAEESP